MPDGGAPDAQAPPVTSAWRRETGGAVRDRPDAGRVGCDEERKRLDFISAVCSDGCRDGDLRGDHPR